MVRPIIQVDLAGFEERKREITTELWSAATDTGFFYLKNTGISEVTGVYPIAVAGFSTRGVQPSAFLKLRCMIPTSSIQSAANTPFAG